MSGKVLAYRRNVGAMLFNRDGLVFVGRRAGLPLEATSVWQTPQGGIDGDEDPEAAVLRELAEEIGTSHAEIIGRHSDWLTYDLPAELIGRVLGGRYRGQTQRWFALRFLGTDDDIRLNAHYPQEFDAWRWVPLAEIPTLAVSFKREIYTQLAQEFRRYARSDEGGGSC